MSESRELSKNELIEAWSQEVQRAGTLTVIHTNAIAQHIGLSATEFEAVDVISRNQPITAGQLAVFCGLTTGATTGLIDRLVGLHCVKREKDQNDRRKVLLVPVEDRARSKKIIALYQPMAERFAQIAHSFDSSELELLINAQIELNDMAQDVTSQLNSKK